MKLLPLFLLLLGCTPNRELGKYIVNCERPQYIKFFNNGSGMKQRRPVLKLGDTAVLYKRYLKIKNHKYLCNVNCSTFYLELLSLPRPVHQESKKDVGQPKK